MNRRRDRFRGQREDVRRRGISLVSGARRRPLPLDQACAVLGTGRSGTTWLTELLASDDRTLPIFEPLHPRRTPAGAMPSMHGFHVVHRAAPRPDLHQYLTLVLGGRLLNPWTLRDASLRQALGAERVLAKMIRFCAAAGWLEQQFPQVRTVAVVRHPCAVVASMRTAAGRWREVPSSFFRGYVEAALGIEPNALLPARELDEVERFAALWTADNVALLRDTTPGQTLLVGFEELLTSPRATLADLDRHLGLGIDVEAVDVSRASSTSGSHGRMPGVSEVGRWRERLRRSEIDTVLRITAAAGIGWVSVDPFLDMDRHRAAHGIARA